MAYDFKHNIGDMVGDEVVVAMSESLYTPFDKVFPWYRLSKSVGKGHDVFRWAVAYEIDGEDPPIPPPVCPYPPC